jgi:hypothetical protein
LSRRELAAEFLKLQGLKNKGLLTIGDFSGCTRDCDLRTTPFNLPYVYDFMIKLCRQQAEIISNH